MIKVEIPLKLPSLNEYINVCRTNKFKAARFKAEIEGEIGLFIGRLPRFEKPIQIHFIWIEENRRRDYDNICFAKKFILDALVKKGKLKDDNRNCVSGFSDSFGIGEKTKIILYIEEMGEMV